MDPETKRFILRGLAKRTDVGVYTHRRGSPTFEVDDRIHREKWPFKAKFQELKVVKSFLKKRTAITQLCLSTHTEIEK